ncbi:uncharacterized protein K452DRAFT_60043 [Aplosporella prunicola CBS 121167]|uniref:Uncharacterized protein n=1 Tax=Aplosporella prunicola CBS 121167 TaxID=1176127 RepID=A0A6A6B9L5_9PEZI|nr:uncharacterized protein K452DRAFT_60043 [Aplosporella prunicola CBS 121167]KAF2140053.1 hypothetical protein K452DRAFT_60043 [Aplosporella prunicola CBS 121167]
MPPAGLERVGVGLLRAGVSVAPALLVAAAALYAAVHGSVNYLWQGGMGGWVWRIWLEDLVGRGIEDGGVEGWMRSGLSSMTHARTHARTYARNEIRDERNANGNVCPCVDHLVAWLLACMCILLGVVINSPPACAPIYLPTYPAMQLISSDLQPGSQAARYRPITLRFRSSTAQHCSIAARATLPSFAFLFFSFGDHVSGRFSLGTASAARASLWHTTDAAVCVRMYGGMEWRRRCWRWRHGCCCPSGKRVAEAAWMSALRYAARVGA